jgi:hypothetical protein
VLEGGLLGPGPRSMPLLQELHTGKRLHKGLQFARVRLPYPASFPVMMIIIIMIIMIIILTRERIIVPVVYTKRTTRTASPATRSVTAPARAQIPSTARPARTPGMGLTACQSAPRPSTTTTASAATATRIAWVAARARRTTLGRTAATAARKQ